jgi:hypothetical protein
MMVPAHFPTQKFARDCCYISETLIHIDVGVCDDREFRIKDGVCSAVA